MSTAELLNVLAKLDKLLDKYRIGYIVVGSLADYLLGISTIEPNDIDILVDKDDIEELNTVFQQEQGIAMLEPIRWREESIIRGLYGRALLDGAVIDIMADVQLKYSDKRILFPYRKLFPCTIEARLTNTITARIPCPEIQVIADRALGRLDRARAIGDVIERKRCNVRVGRCLSTINH